MLESQAKSLTPLKSSEQPAAEEKKKDMKTQPCDVCRKPAFKSCQVCHVPVYCGKVCQTKDWKQIHKFFCKSLPQLEGLKSGLFFHIQVFQIAYLLLFFMSWYFKTSSPLDLKIQSNNKFLCEKIDKNIFLIVKAHFASDCFCRKIASNRFSSQFRKMFLTTKTENAL